MNPTGRLIDDHRQIERMLVILNTASQRVLAGEDVPLADLSQMLAFIREFADHYHHGREEALLFPEMEAAGVPRQGGPIGVMLMEHVAGREYVAAMQEALDLWEKDQSLARQKFVQNANGYVSLLQAHIYKEDQVLFPMAERVLSAEQMDSLQARFDEVEGELLPADKRAQYENLLGEFARRYPASSQ